MVGDGIEFNDDQDNKVEDELFVPKQEQSRQFISIYVQLPYISEDLTTGDPSAIHAVPRVPASPSPSLGI